MAGSKIDGLAVGAIGAGGLLLFAGIRGKSIPSEIQGLIQGKPPSSAKGANPVTGTSGGGTSGGGGGTVPSSGSAQQALQQAAAQKGWGSGPQWQALQSVELAEAGFNPKAQNASGAYGIGQSLGHPYPGGPAPNGVDEYGGYGLTPAQSEAASMGDPGPQALWMVNYIASRWGTPETAWNNEQSSHWY